MKWLWPKRILKITVLTLLALILSLSLAITLFFSQPRMHLWLFSQLDDWTDGLISVRHSEGHIFDRIRLHDIAVRHPALSLDIDQLDWRLDLFHLWYGRLTLEQIHIEHLDIVLLPQPQAAPQVSNPQPFAPLLGIPLLLELDSLRIAQITVQQGEQQYRIERLEARLAWQLRRLALKQLQLEYDGHQLHSSGHTTFHDGETFSGQLTLQLQGETLPNIDLQAGWRGKLQDLSLSLDSEQPLQLRSQHRLRLPEDGPLHLHSRWQQLHYALAPDWALSSSQGEMQLTLNNTLQAEGQFNWQVGELPLAQQQFHLQFDLEDQLDINTRSELADGSHWTLAGRALLASQQIHARLDSDLDLRQFHPDAPAHYRGSMVLALRDFADPHLSLELTDTQLQLPEYDAELGGQLSLHAGALLGDARADIDLHDLTVRQGEHRATISGPLQLQLSEPAAPSLHIDSRELQIAWQEHTAQLQLRADIETGPRLALHQFQLVLGDNRIQASGHYAEQIRLQLHARLNKPEQLLPGLGGQLQLEASLQGDSDAPQGQLSVQGRGLRYQDLQLATLSLDAHSPLQQPWLTRLRLELGDMQRQDGDALQRLFDTLQLVRRADDGAMHTKLNLAHPGLNLALDIQDQLSSLHQPRVRITALQLDTPETGHWQLEQAVDLQWLGAHRLQGEPLCLQPQQGNEAARLCLHAQNETIHWHWQALPVFTWLKPLMPEALRIDGLLDGQGELSLGEQPMQDWQLQQRISTRELDVALEQLGYVLPLQLHSAELQLQADALAAHLEVRAGLNQTGQIDARIDLANTRQDWANATLTGSLRGEINELELPEDLRSLFELQQQHLRLHSTLSGTLSAPEHQSGAELEMLADIPLLGLQQQQLRLTTTLDTDSIRAEGHLQQPEQRSLQFTAHIDGLQQPQPSGQIHIEADDMQWVDSPFASLRSAAAVQVQLQGHALHIGGNLSLHHSRIDLQRMPLQSRTRVSSDEVILDPSGQPVEAADAGPTVHLDLAIAFGEEVQILLRDVQAWLGGAIVLHQRPGEDLRTSGQVLLERGHIQLDPRNRIRIDRSSFTFTGPAGNPTLDVQLGRQVEQYQTFLNVTGTATQPQFVFYSTPSLSQGNIINLMIFGRAVDVDREPNYESQLLSALYKLGLSGNAPVLSQITTSLGIHDVYFDIQDEQSSNLILGRALTDRLYIRYAMGLSDRQNNAVQMFYQLGKRWSLESLSGDDQQSLDLIWSKEK